MSATPSLFAGIGFQFFSNNGIPLAGGKVFSYLAGTTTPVATYVDKDGVQAHPNPIILDSAGRVPSGGEIWLLEGQATEYKFVLKDATDVLIATYDYVPGTYAANDLSNDTNPALGDNLVGFRQSNSSGNLVGAVGRTVHDKLQEFVSVKDFGATGDGVTDDSAAIQAAVDAASAVFIPAGNYFLASTVTLPNKTLVLRGEGKASRIFGNAAALIAYPVAIANLTQDIHDIFFEMTGDNIAVKMHQIWAANGKDGPTISNCFFFNSSSITTTAKAISLSGVWTANIINNSFLGRGSGGGPTTGIGGYGIFIELGLNFNTSVMNVFVSGNSFTLLAFPYWASDRAINTGGRIEGNRISNNSFVAGSTAIRSIKGLATLVSNNIISDFNIGIDFDGEFNFVINGNTEVDGREASIFLKGNATSFLERGVISGNYITVRSTSIGIRIDNSIADARVRALTITGNFLGRVFDTAVLSSTGIAFTGAFITQLISIAGNTFNRVATGIDYVTATNQNINLAGNTFSVSNTAINNPARSGVTVAKQYEASVVIALTGGTTSETVNLAIPANTFLNPPRSAYIMQNGDSAERMIGFFSSSLLPGSLTTATNAEFTVVRLDGGTIIGGNKRFTFLCATTEPTAN